MNMEVLADSSSVAQKAASVIAEEARAAVAARGFFIMAVSGGHTPWDNVAQLGDAGVPWPAIHIVQVDERVAPSGDPDRNLTHIRGMPARPRSASTQSDFCDACRSGRSGCSSRTIFQNTAGNCRIAAGARPGPPRSWSRWPHCVAGAGRSGAGRRRRGCGVERTLSGPAQNDLDLPDHQSRPAHFMGGDRSEKAEMCKRLLRGSSFDSGGARSPRSGPGVGGLRRRGDRRRLNSRRRPAMRGK